MKGARLIAILFLAPALPTSVANAQTLTEAQRAEAATEFDAGLADFAAGNMEGAHTHFERAYEISRHPSVLFNLAQTRRRLGRLRAADTAIVELLEREDVDAESQLRARDELREIREEMPVLSIRVENLARTDEVRVDGRVLSHDSLELLRLDPGEHTLEVVRSGLFHRSQLIDLPRGTQRTIELHLPGAATDSSAETTRPARSARTPWGLTLGHGAIGLAIGTGVGALIGMAAGAAIACGGSSCGLGLLFGAMGGSWLLAPAGVAFGATAFDGFAADTIHALETVSGAYLGAGLGVVVGLTVSSVVNEDEDVARDMGFVSGAFSGALFALLLGMIFYVTGQPGPDDERETRLRLAPTLSPTAEGGTAGLAGVF